jgi:uncharacterized protein (DUF58 family)
MGVKKKSLAKYLNTKAISTVGGLAINPKSLVEGHLAGAHKSPFHGFSVEFAGHREYMAGDDPKHIDWNVYYKRDKYFIKQYEAETNLVAQVLLDASESMNFKSGDISKLDYANTLAVSLAYLITNANDAFGISVFDEKIIEFMPPSNSMAMVYKISDTLEKVKSNKGTNTSHALLDFAGRLGRRQVVAIISDALMDIEDLQTGLARLQFDRQEVVFFHIMDPYEVDFPMDGLVHFKGLEGMGEIKLQPKAFRKAYLERFKAHLIQLQDLCERNGVEYVPVNTGRPIEEMLLGYMNSRLTFIAH